MIFILHDFLMTGYCSSSQISKIKQCYHFGILKNLENWFLVSEMKKESAKRKFFWNSSLNILLAIQNISLDLHQTWHDFALPQRDTFPLLRSANNVASLMTLQKLFFFLVNSKNDTLPDYAGIKLTRSGWTLNKLCMMMQDTSVHETERV